MHRGLGNGTDEGIDDLAVLQREDRGDGLHLEGRGHAGVGVYIDLHQRHLALRRGHHPLEDGAQRAARTAPLGPQVDHDRDLGGAVEHIAFEGVIGDVEHVASCQPGGWPYDSDP